MANISKIPIQALWIITALTATIVMLTMVQVADAPILKALTPSEGYAYQIDNHGRIMDKYGWLRGWMKGAEVYSPSLELKYRLFGRQLRDF